MPLDDAPRGYEMFNNKEDECIKIVLKPLIILTLTWRAIVQSTRVARSNGSRDGHGRDQQNR